MSSPPHTPSHHPARITPTRSPSPTPARSHRAHAPPRDPSKKTSDRTPSSPPPRERRLGRFRLRRDRLPEGRSRETRRVKFTSKRHRARPPPSAASRRAARPTARDRACIRACIREFVRTWTFEWFEYERRWLVEAWVDGACVVGHDSWVDGACVVGHDAWVVTRDAPASTRGSVVPRCRNSRRASSPTRARARARRGGR